jgi:hypothetical protein
MAARIERAECQTVRAFAAELQARGADVLMREIGGATAVFAGDGQPINKLAGLGFAGPLDEAALQELERAYDERAAELRVELATLADLQIGVMLTRRGYELAGYENVLGLALNGDLVDGLQLAQEADAARGLFVTRAAEDETRTWIETVATGFGQPDEFDGPPPTESFALETLFDVMGVATRVPGTALYLARRQGTVAGGGSIRISDGLAQMSGASTLPQHRRNGVQSAVLRSRLLDAARHGSDLAIVTTEPGSKSQQNVQRMGFELLYSRAVLLRRRRA